MLKVEKWWGELHQRLEKFCKENLARLKNQCHYDPTNDIHGWHIYVSNKQKLYADAN